MSIKKSYEETDLTLNKKIQTKDNTIQITDVRIFGQ